MSCAFPNLLGCFIGLDDAPGGEDLGMVVGWAGGYLVYATSDARLGQVAFDQPGLRITGRGSFTDGDDVESVLPIPKRAACA